MKRGVCRVHHTDSRIVSGLNLQVIDLRVTTTGNLPFRLGSRLKTSNKPGKVVARPQRSPRSLPRDSSLINDNHCVNSVTGQKNSVHVTGQGDLNPAPVVSENSKVTLNFNADSHVANAHIVTGLPQRKGVNPNACQLYTKIKYVKDVFLCRSLAFCKSCHQCPTCCFRSSCRGEVKPVLGEMGNPGFKSKSGKHSEGGLHASLPVQTPLDKVTDCNKQLPQSNQTVLPFRGTVSADKQNCSRTGGKSKLTGVLQPAIFGTQTQQPVETDPRPEHLEHLFKHRVVQDGDPRDNKNLPTDRGVGHIHRFQRRILPHTNSQSIQEVHAFSPPGSVLPVQSPSLWPVHSPHGVHSGGQRGQTHGTSKGIRIHQYLDDWLVRASTHDTCLQHTQTLVTLCQELGWLVNREKSELVPQQVFNFVGYQFDLKEGRVRPTEERWQTLTDKIRSILSDPVCPVRKFMSLIGLLTATEKQVHLGRLHMRPIQWHLKNNWRVPESLEKVIPVPKSLHPHLRW